jgi:hypothetical protein
MRSRFLSVGLGVWAVGSLVLLNRCVSDGDTTTIDGGNDVTTNDAVGNDVVQPPDAGFTLSLAPGHVTEDPGDNYPVTINVNRANGFADPVSFVVTTPPGFTATQPAPAGSSSQFYIATNADAGAGDFDVTVTGSSTSLVQTAKLGVHVGSLLAIGDGGVVTIPSFATFIDVKAWGAGGGSGNWCVNQMSGGLGGAGGFAQATVPVQGGATYLAYVGGGGGFSSGDCSVGGGGGGYSGFLAADGGPLVVAAGGGGGASAWYNGGGNCPTGNGGAGGGASGGAGYGTGSPNYSSTAPGAQDGGGAGTSGGSSGSYLQGGNAAGSGAPAGTPGGGNGGTHAGGGGGGYYGGAGGGEYTITSPSCGGAGGGGAGYNPFDGGTNITSDSGVPPNASDPDYATNVGTAGTKIAGGPGRVVIRLPKP